MTLLCNSAPSRRLKELELLIEHRNLDPDPTRENLLESFALEVCGVAFTAATHPVLVNAFGPVAYCEAPNIYIPALGFRLG